MNLDQAMAFAAFYNTDVILEDAIDSLKNGCRVTVKLEREEDYTPLRMVRKKSKKHTTIYRMFYRFADEPWGRVDEIWFLGYNVSSSSGARARFELVDHDDWLPFRQQHQGAIMELLLVELDEEGAPINQEERDVLERATLPGGPLSRRAAMLCKDIDFQRWVAKRIQAEEWDEKQATQFVYDRCGIESRRILDHDDGAAALFKEYVHRPFIKSLRPL